MNSGIAGLPAQLKTAPPDVAVPLQLADPEEVVRRLRFMLCGSIGGL
jgi:hypothetical protein